MARIGDRPDADSIPRRVGRGSYRGGGVPMLGIRNFRRGRVSRRRRAGERDLEPGLTGRRLEDASALDHILTDPDDRLAELAVAHERSMPGLRPGRRTTTATRDLGEAFRQLS